MAMIVECKGLQIGQFWIPPFELNAGEIIGLCLFGGEHFYPLEREIVAFLTQTKKHANIIVHEPLRFVEQFPESPWRRLFFPTTVGDYVQINSRRGSKIPDNFYAANSINPSTRVNTLAGNLKKWLTLYTALSHTDKIVFDLVGLDPIGAQQTLTIVRKTIGANGAALLLDNFDDSQTESQCTKYLRIEINQELRKNENRGKNG